MAELEEMGALVGRGSARSEGQDPVMERCRRLMSHRGCGGQVIKCPVFHLTTGNCPLGNCPLDNCPTRFTISQLLCYKPFPAAHLKRLFKFSHLVERLCPHEGTHWVAWFEGCRCVDVVQRVGELTKHHVTPTTPQITLEIFRIQFNGVVEPGNGALEIAHVKEAHAFRLIR